MRIPLTTLHVFLQNLVILRSQTLLYKRLRIPHKWKSSMFFRVFLHFLTFLAPQMLLYKHFRPLKSQNRLQPWMPCFKRVWGLSKFVFCRKMTKSGPKVTIFASHVDFTALKTLLYKHFSRRKGAKSSRFSHISGPFSIFSPFAIYANFCKEIFFWQTFVVWRVLLPVRPCWECY